VPTASKISQLLKRKSEKANQFFLTPAASKKAKYVKFGVKKANLQPCLYDVTQLTSVLNIQASRTFFK